MRGHVRFPSRGLHPRCLLLNPLVALSYVALSLLLNGGPTSSSGATDWRCKTSILRLRSSLLRSTLSGRNLTLHKTTQCAIHQHINALSVMVHEHATPVRRRFATVSRGHTHASDPVRILVISRAWNAYWTHACMQPARYASGLAATERSSSSYA